MRNRRIGVLMGGLSSERVVSMASGQAVLRALVDRGYNAVPIFVDRDVDLVLRQHGIEIAFLALHGRYGEDGSVQGMLEIMGIPYTGSDVLASALAMNKVKSKELFRLHNLPTPPHYVVDAERLASLGFYHGDFGFPAVVKPSCEGSSVGVEIVDDIDELSAACERALCFDSEVLVERYVAGQEVSVAVLEDRAIGAVEICTDGSLYDYATKYNSGECTYHVPPRVSPERYRGLLTQAELAHRALGCSGATRVDMMLSETGNEFVLEVNTVPGLTPTSLLPKIALEAGMPFADLVESILCGSRLANLERGNNDRRIKKRPFDGAERREGGVAEHH